MQQKQAVPLLTPSNADLGVAGSDDLDRGIFKVGWIFTFAAAAYNLVRMRIWQVKRRRPRSQRVRGPAKRSAGQKRIQPKLFPESQNRGAWRESKSRHPFVRSGTFPACARSFLSLWRCC